MIPKSIRDTLDMYLKKTISSHYLLIVNVNLSKMGQRKEYDVDVRQLIIFYGQKRKTYREIGAMFGIRKSIVADIIRRFHHENGIESIPQIEETYYVRSS